MKTKPPSNLRGLCQNEGMHPTPVKEGKIELIADRDGLFRVDVERLNAVNDVEQIHGGHPAYQYPGQSRGQAGRDAGSSRWSSKSSSWSRRCRPPEIPRCWSFCPISCSGLVW